MPPTALADPKGKRLLSWRVAILPYLGEQNLYNQFKLDEPWDNDNNKKLLAQMPAVYGADRVETYYQAFAGLSTAFEDGKRIKFDDIAHGRGRTEEAERAGVKSTPNPANKANSAQRP